MSDEQIFAVFRCRFGPEAGQPFSKTVEECITILLATYPGHQTVEGIFESGALSPQWRDEDAYPMFGVEP